MLRTARILLPGRLPDTTVLDWAGIAVLTEYPEDIDGYTDWSNLVELRPGVDARSLPVAACGRFDDNTVDRLLSISDGLGEQLWSWAPSAAWSDATQSTMPSAASPAESAHLSQFARRWRSEGFSGKAWSGEMSIEAPSYADSVIVTAPEGLLQQLTEAGLEVHRVSRGRHIPIWRD